VGHQNDFAPRGRGLEDLTQLVRAAQFRQPRSAGLFARLARDAPPAIEPPVDSFEIVALRSCGDEPRDAIDAELDEPIEHLVSPAALGWTHQDLDAVEFGCTIPCARDRDRLATQVEPHAVSFDCADAQGPEPAAAVHTHDRGPALEPQDSERVTLVVRIEPRAPGPWERREEEPMPLEATVAVASHAAILGRRTGRHKDPALPQIGFARYDPRP